MQTANHEPEKSGQQNPFAHTGGIAEDAQATPCAEAGSTLQKAAAPKTATPEKGVDTGAGFLASVLKYSVPTYIGFAISGVALVLRGMLPPERTADPALFLAASATLMNMGILGLDQGLLRFFSEPPKGHTGRSLFKLCTCLSAAVLFLAGLVCSIFFPSKLAGLLSLSNLGGGVIPLLFLNAFFYMLVRYINVLLRLEGRLFAYTVETVCMQACFNLIYLFACFFTVNPFAPAILATASFGAVALAYSFTLYGGKTVSQVAKAPLKPALAAILPYSLALAPTGIMLTFNTTAAGAYIGNTLGLWAKGVFSFGVVMAQMVSAIQAGFATFWGPYVFANHKTQQGRIAKVQDVLSFLIFSFFCCLVAFEDILFWLFPSYKACLAFFPLLMLNVVFFILCEGTVYGIAIAKKPVYDTAGIAIYAIVNLALCPPLCARYGLLGAAGALAAAACCMFTFRTFFAQRFYKTITNPKKTLAGFALCLFVAFCGTALATTFTAKGLCCLAALVLYCLLYKAELFTILRMAKNALQSFLNKRRAT